MLMAAKNQFKVMALSIKYSLMRELLNKTTFFTNVIFMILNNASFLIQWIIIFSLKDSVGSYTMKEIILLWGIAASTYGFAHFFFSKAFTLYEIIINGKLDSYLVQPKNVLLSVITSEISVSALGDMVYGLIMLLIYGISIEKLFLFILFTISGGLILVSVAVMLSSLSFWFGNSETISEVGYNLIVYFQSYPDSIFKGIVKILLYTVVPLGLISYIPLSIMIKFDLNLFLIVIISTMLFIIVAFSVFNRGLKRYSSSNLMMSRI